MNPLRDTKYFSLDLELNNKKDRTIPKIIQVGAAIGSPLRPEDIQSYSWFLDPEEPITPFITELTGITDEIIQEKSVSHEVVAQEFGELLKVNNVFPNPITWGQNDAEELKNEFRVRNIDFPFFGRRIIDVKTIYVFLEMVNGRSPAGGLSKSMGRYKIPFNGKSHRADVDAVNTLRFYFYLLQRQNVLETCMSTMKNIAY
jgi:DNA polymerase III epsilon subunit-like protein